MMSFQKRAQLSPPLSALWLLVVTWTLPLCSVGAMVMHDDAAAILPSHDKSLVDESDMWSDYNSLLPAEERTHARKRHIEFLGGKRAVEFLGGKRSGYHLLDNDDDVAQKRAIEFLAGKRSTAMSVADDGAAQTKRAIEFLGGKRATSSVVADADKRAIEFLSGKRSTTSDIADAKRAIEFLGGKRSAAAPADDDDDDRSTKRAIEFLGGKRAVEFLGGRKRAIEFLGGKRSARLLPYENKRGIEFLSGKRSASTTRLDDAIDAMLRTPSGRDERRRTLQLLDEIRRYDDAEAADDAAYGARF